jgi:toxin YoeB
LSNTLLGKRKTEMLKFIKAYSRRIDDTDRLVYTVDKLGLLVILSCYGHYED